MCPDFTVIPADIDEALPALVRPGDIVALALRKARAVAARPDVTGVVLGADTVVVVDGVPFGKPVDAADARRMLLRLRGRMHEVVTGVAAVGGGREATRVVVSQVLMRAYDDGTLEAYLAGGEPLDKAGAYALQGAGQNLVAAVIGSYTNVVGLPLVATRELLAEFGVATSGPGPRA